MELQMTDEQTRGSPAGFAVGICIGFVAGAIAALLLAPESGDVTRARLQAATREGDGLPERLSALVRDQVTEFLSRVGEELSGTLRGVLSNGHIPERESELEAST
jgi:gas vesicle protein